MPPRLLVADDDAEMRAWIVQALRPFGCELVEVDCGLDLLDLIAADPTFDGVITDIRMPGPDGLSVVAMVRTAGLAVPIVVITAFPEPAILETVGRMDGVTLLEKPVPLDELRGAVRALLASRGPR